MKKLFILSVLLFFVFACQNQSEAKTQKMVTKKTIFDPFSKLSEYQKIIKKRKLNTQYIFVVDYELHSGKKRMYVLDILKHKIVRKMIVAHGEKSETKLGYATDFSNVPESNKSSLGYCIVNQRDYSNWGNHVKYLLDGISKTNSNMRKRIIVLHSYEMVPSFETYPLPIVTSLGCVMISKPDMNFLDKLIKKQHNKKILMYIRA